MSGIRNLRLEVILSAIDKATRPIKAMRSSSSGLSKQLKETRDRLKELNQAQGSITAFRTLTKEAKDSSEKLAAARQKLKSLAEQMAAAGPPTDAMVRRLKSSEIAVEKLTLATRKKIDAAKDARSALDANGISVTKLSASERDLAGKIDATSAAMKRQQDRLTKISELQNRHRGSKARYEQGLEARDRLAGGGAATVAAGTAIGLPIVKMVKDYSSFEDAMLGVARQVDGAKDANGKLTPTYYQMGDAIKAMSEKIPMATTEIAALVEGGARMGIQGKQNLLEFARTAALASTAFDLPADEISENMGKIAQLYQVPIKNISQLGDVINYLDDNAQSKGADIIDVMQRIAGSTGTMDYKQAAALGSTFLSLGASSEIAATATKAMVRELQIAEKQPKRFQRGLKELHLNAKKIQADMAKDSTGTIMKVMETVNKLPKARQMGVMVDLFGKEYAPAAAKLSGHLDEWRRQLDLAQGSKASGSMQREGDSRNDTLSAKKQMTDNKLFNESSELGKNLRQPLMEVMDSIGNVLKYVNEWTKANPALAASLVKIAAVTAIILTVIGGFMLAIAGILGPIVAMKFAMSYLGIELTGGIGILGKLGTAIRLLGTVFAFVGRLFLLNPIGLVITAIAVGAFLIWRNWDTLGPKFKAMWEAVKTAFAAGWNWIKTTAVAAFTWYFSLPGKFLTLGAQLMQGLVQGIANGLGAVKDAITGAGEKTIGWFKEKLGIHSPSRVFAELGGFTMAGLHQGLTAGADGPLGAVKAMAAKLTTAGAGIAIGAASTLAQAVPFDHRPPLAAAQPIQSAGGMHIGQLVIQAAPGMDERKLAVFVRMELERYERERQARGRGRLSDKD